MSPSTTFDAYVAVDWSANSTPKTGADSIWIGWGRWEREGLSVRQPVNPSTRATATATVAELLTELVGDGCRVLVGFDFPYGYPGGLAKALSLHHTGGAWMAVWDELSSLISDDSDNANNRFKVASMLNSRLGGTGPFWACPAGAASPTLPVRKGLFPHQTSTGTALREYRLVEEHLRATRRSVHSAWKLFTAGSVGSQALLGIPHLARLRSEPSLRERTCVWPFETGFRLPERAERPGVVHVEIWPGLSDVSLTRHRVKDAAQVVSVVEEFAERDAGGSLRSMFSPKAVPSTHVSVCQSEEGWIFGA